MDISKFIPTEIWAKEEFDRTVTINIVRRINKHNRNLENIQCIAPPRTYDYLKDSKSVDVLIVRFVKIRLNNGSCEYLATNLTEEFTFQDLKELYKLRWNIENSYRGLKYADALSYIHSIDRNNTLQEIYSKLTYYNYSSALTNIADEEMVKEQKNKEKVTGKKKKYLYISNKTMAAGICLDFLLGKISDVMQEIKRYALPVKPGRSFPRNLRRQSARGLYYR